MRHKKPHLNSSYKNDARRKYLTMKLHVITTFSWETAINVVTSPSPRVKPAQRQGLPAWVSPLALRFDTRHALVFGGLVSWGWFWMRRAWPGLSLPGSGWAEHWPVARYTGKLDKPYPGQLGAGCAVVMLNMLFGRGLALKTCRGSFKHGVQS